MKKTLSIIMLSCFVFTISAQELVKTIIPGMKVSLSIPSDFILMPDEMKARKYPNKPGPSIVYANVQGSITIGIGLAKYNTATNNIENCVSVLQKAIDNTHPSAEWISSGVMNINNKKVGYIEFVVPITDMEIYDVDMYNLMFFTEYESKLLMCNFNCSVDNDHKWYTVAHKIMNSIDISMK